MIYFSSEWPMEVGRQEGWGASLALLLPVAPILGHHSMSVLIVPESTGRRFIRIPPCWRQLVSTACQPRIFTRSPGAHRTNRKLVEGEGWNRGSEESR